MQNRNEWSAMTPPIVGSVEGDRQADELACPSCRMRRLREACLPAMLSRSPAVLVAVALSVTSIAPTGAFGNSGGKRATAETTTAQGDDAPDLGGATDDLSDEGGAAPEDVGGGGDVELGTPGDL